MRMGWLSLLGAVALAGPACGGTGTADTDDPGESGDRPSPYAESGESSGGPPPSLGADEVVDAAMTGLRTFVKLEPDAAIDAVEAMLVLEAECPEEQAAFVEGESTVILWASEGCTTSAGLEFRGAGRFERFTIAEGAAVGEGAMLSSEGGTMRMTAADGRFVELSGYVYYQRATSGEDSESYFEVNGQIAADPATASPLLDGTLRAQGGLYSYSGGGYEAIGGAGSLGAGALPGALAFQFSDFLFVPEACGREPLGTVSVRDDAGYWHDLVFDVGTLVEGEEPVFDAAKCDGCGAYLVGGQRQGEACVAEADLLALVEWEGLPW